MKRLFCLTFLFCLCGLPQAGADAPFRWTTIRGRIVFDGSAPETTKLEITRDEEFCGQFALRDESLLVHPSDGGVKNAVVFLRTRQTVPVHPSYAQPPRQTVHLDNVQCRFVPRIQLLRTGQTWEVGSTDPIAHNVAVYARRNDPFSQVIPRNEPLRHTFSRPESVPVRIDCSIHAWMRAWLVITDHPYAAVTDEHGRFEIARVPQGTWPFRFWHERCGPLTKLHQAGQTRSLKSGIWKLDLSDDILDLGDLTVDPELLKP